MRFKPYDEPRKPVSIAVWSTSPCPLTAGSRGIATCFQVSFLLLLRFGERARSQKEKRDYPEEFPIQGLSPLSTAMDMSQKNAFENRIVGMSNGRQAPLFCYRGVADLIHFTGGRFSTSPAYIGSTNRSLAAGGALNSLTTPRITMSPTGSNVHLEGDLRLTSFQSIS